MGMADGRYGNSGSRFQFGGGGPLTPGIKVLLILMTAVFVAEYLIAVAFGQRASDQLFLWFGLIPYAVIHGLRIWQPFTYLFLHDGLMHILVNMFVLWMFGRILEPMWGERRFLNYFFICGIGAGLINVAGGPLHSACGRAPFVPLRNRRGTDQCGCRTFAHGMGPGAFDCADGWRFRSNLRNTNRLRDFIS